VLLSLAPHPLEKLVPAPLQLVAAAQADESVTACGTDAGGVDNVFTGYETFGIAINNYCGGAPGGLQINNDTVNTIPPGMSSGWVATAPAGLEIAGASVPSMYLSPTTVGTGYIADFYWAGGSQRVDNSSGSTYGVGGIFPSSIFGFDLECNPSGTPCPADGAGFVVYDIQLDVREIVNPSITAIGATNLWYTGASEYVRGGGWSIAFSATAPSGIASMSASEDGQPVQLPIPPGCPVSNHAVWQQCPGTQTWSPTVSLSGDGAQQLTLSASSAAGNTSPYNETIHVDNTQPTVALSGPTVASSTAGMQYVTATATVGPSGLGSIECSVDGGPNQSYTSSPATIPVSGLGMHSVECTATNRSYDSQGQPATSTPATWQLDIANPTVSAISFAKIVHSLRCKRVKERVRIRAGSVMVHRHGRLVKVRHRAHIKVVKVVKCHVRVIRRKVTVLVKVKRHGKTVTVKRRRLEKVILPPRIVAEATKRVRHGRSATVHGFLATSDGVALGGQTMEVLTAPDNGLGQWSQAASVTTGADGGWTAQLAPGPSRLVEAIYSGDATTESSTSGQVRLVIPAKVELLTATPRRVAWGGTVRIVGELLGGYLPPGGALVRLRIGSGSSSTTYGVKEHVSGTGRFSTTYTFGAGQASSYQTFWFQISSLPMGSYPFAPNDSRRRSVLVGGHPAIARHKHRARKHKRRR
jgi:hypothetical protein